MDKDAAIELSRLYLDKVRKNNIPVLEAWLFGSVAKGTNGENSDIDLALVLPNRLLSFETEVQLMILRNGEETMIEPHTYSKKDFVSNTPMVAQIRKYGLCIHGIQR